jgi:hypothetical protein
MSVEVEAQAVVPALENVVMHASAERTATGQATAISGLRPYSYATIMLDITAIAADCGDALDVAIQRLLPDGATWDTIARFAQVAGDDCAPSTQVIDIAGASGGGQRDADESTSSPTLAAATTLDVAWGDQLRVIYIVTDTCCNAAFTFSVTANFRT